MAPGVPAGLHRGKPRVRLLQKDLHLNYWWSFVCQHQRPGIDIHADHSDVSLNFGITPASANLSPVVGCRRSRRLDLDDYNSGARDVPAFLRREVGRTANLICLRREQGLLFKGTIFHRTAACRFADGFENRRRNVTMLFRRTLN